MKYKWTNVETGTTGISEFNGSQDEVFSDPDNYGKRTQLKAANALINRWNLINPNFWQYELIEE